MGKTFSVESYEEMTRISRKLAEHAGNYSKFCNQLQTEADFMDSWEGADNKAFIEKIRECIIEVREMTKSLERASELIEQEKNNYVETQNGILADIPKLP